MKFTYFTMLHLKTYLSPFTKYNYFIIISFFLLACGSGSSSQSTIDLTENQEDTNERPEKKEKVIQLPKITQDNVNEILSKFGKENPETLVLMKTRLGDVKFRLYEGTPLHRANFIQLVKRSFYEGTVFHRVVKGLIVQGGNLDDPIIKKRKKSIGKYRVPAEFQPNQYYHKRGALASPRIDQGNPEKRSNPYEFYIVQGNPQPANTAQLLANESGGGVTYQAEQLQVYNTIGGLPHLDGLYTVFGEVVEGMDVIDKISEVEVDKSDNWPFEDIEISMEVLE